MKTEFLKNLGEFMTQEVIDKIMAEHGKTVGEIKAKLDTANTEISDWKTKYGEVETALKAFDGVNVEDLRKQINTLTDTVQTTQKDWERKYSERELQYNVKEYIKGKNFRLPELEEHYSGKIITALADEKNKGKNFDDILNEFIKDNDGNVRTDLFVDETPPEPINPNKLSIGDKGLPPAGGVLEILEKNPFDKKTFDLGEQVKLFKENPAQAREMADKAGYKLPE